MNMHSALLTSAILSAIAGSASAAETYCNTRTGACGAYSAVVRTPSDVAFLRVQQKTQAQQASAARQTLTNQVTQQTQQSGSACNGYWQGGRCVPNGNVAYSGGSPVNRMNPPQSVNAGGGQRQTCTLVYTYRAGKVVGSPQSVCTFG